MRKHLGISCLFSQDYAVVKGGGGSEAPSLGVEPGGEIFV
jgi:hypothetical protein